MAIIRCPHCERPIADTSETCVHCGYVLPKSPESTYEVRMELSDDSEKVHNFPYTHADFAQKKLVHKHDFLCFFVPPVGLYFSIYYLTKHDTRWKNSLWSTFLGAVVYFALINIILGFFGL